MQSFYPDAFEEFIRFVDENHVNLPRGVCSKLTDDQFEALYRATVIHEKPLTNALGPKFLDVLTKSRVREIFEAI